MTDGPLQHYNTQVLITGMSETFCALPWVLSQKANNSNNKSKISS